MALRRKSSLVPGCQALRPVQSKPRHCFMVDMKVLQLCSGCGNPQWCHPLSCSSFAQPHLGLVAETRDASTAYGILQICIEKLF